MNVGVAFDLAQGGDEVPLTIRENRITLEAGGKNQHDFHSLGFGPSYILGSLIICDAGVIDSGAFLNLFPREVHLNVSVNLDSTNAQGDITSHSVFFSERTVDAVASPENAFIELRETWTLISRSVVPDHCRNLGSGAVSR